jgi:hypothetical protein
MKVVGFSAGFGSSPGIVTGPVLETSSVHGDRCARRPDRGERGIVTGKLDAHLLGDTQRLLDQRLDDL